MIRLRSPHSHVVASVQGNGHALIGGKAVDLKPGEVLLAPAGLHHAYEVAGRGPWHMAWVFFDDGAESPVLKGRQPEIVRAADGVGDFDTLLKMLTREVSAGAAASPVIEALVTLLDTALRRIVGIGKVDTRLSRLWTAVEGDLAREWSVAEMAQLACMSEEHLRRLCHKHYRRSPAAQLTQFRLRRAGMLLRVSAEKMESVAQQVGYASVYSFSAAFRRWSGVPPARFRREAEMDLGARATSD